MKNKLISILIIAFVLLFVYTFINNQNKKVCTKKDNYKIYFDDEKYEPIEVCDNCEVIEIPNGLSKMSQRFTYYTYLDQNNNEIRVEAYTKSNTLKAIETKDESGCVTGYQDIHLKSHTTHDGTIVAKPNK